MDKEKEAQIIENNKLKYAKQSNILPLNLKLINIYAAYVNKNNTAKYVYINASL